MRSGDLALTSTRSADGTGGRVQVARRQADGSWLRVIDRPELPEDARSPAWLTLAVMSAGLFLAVLSTTVVSVALPTMGRDLHASPADLEWIVDAYVIVYASLLVAGGAAGDRYGRKGLFLLGTAIFGLGSLAAGLAPAVGVLLAARVLQGIGPALLVPGSLTILRATFTDERQRAVAIGVWSTASGLALAAGAAARRRCWWTGWAGAGCS